MVQSSQHLNIPNTSYVEYELNYGRKMYYFYYLNLQHNTQSSSKTKLKKKKKMVEIYMIEITIASLR